MAETTFKDQTILRTFTSLSFEHPETRISAAALKGSGEYLRIFAREAVWRSEQQRQRDSGSGGPANKVLEVRHLEKIAGTMVLDFS